MRKTETFQNEQDAKAFAKAKLADGSNINAGTLNPHQPKRIIRSVQIFDWLNEPDEDRPFAAARQRRWCVFLGRAAKVPDPVGR